MGTARKDALPKGKEFSPGLNIARLRKISKRTKDPKVPLRAAAARLRRKRKLSVREIADMLDVEYRTVYNWLLRIHLKGEEGLYDKKAPGAKSKLDDKDLKKVEDVVDAGTRKAGFESHTWTSTMLIGYIKREFGVEYCQSAVWYMLKKMGFSFKKSRPKHPKSATKKQRAAFKRKFRALVRALGPRQFKAFFGDEAGVVTGMETGYDWTRSGLRTTVRFSAKFWTNRVFPTYHACNSLVQTTNHERLATSKAKNPPCLHRFQKNTGSWRRKPADCRPMCAVTHNCVTMALMTQP